MTPIELVDTLARAANRAEPPLLEDHEMRWMVDRAIRRADVPVGRIKIWYWPVVAALFAGVAAIVWFSRPLPLPVVATNELALPTGDRITATAGTQVEIESLALSRRRIRVRGGVVAIAVAPLSADQRFEVATDHLVAATSGGVFSVDDSPGISRVQVFDGPVDVTQGGTTHAVFAGAVWNSATARTTLDFTPPIALHRVITAALTEHRHVAVAPKRTVAPPAIAPPIAKAQHATVPAVVHRDPAVSTRTSGSPWSTDTVPLEQMTPAQLLATARGQVKSAQYTDALATLERIRPLPSAGYQLVGDARRALGQLAAAADAYDQVGDLESSYTAAYLRHHDLHDDARALTSLGVADAEGSPLEERALALRVQILVGLHRDPSMPAARYLERFPTGDLRAYMLSERTRPPAR
ncbi:MAG TPA: FecR domain-containing protein [Kofleriaceae bacterium]